MLLIWFWSGKRFSTYGLKVTLSNQDMAYAQLRYGFAIQVIFDINIHSMSNFKFIIFSTDTQRVLDLWSEV